MTEIIDRQKKALSDLFASRDALSLKALNKLDLGKHQCWLESLLETTEQLAASLDFDFGAQCQQMRT